ncbi:MAG: hypothetical protein PHC85_02445 [Candidatus Pacebacteria bacterium]|nr:hypothetical protein [Candidatus Paceibacterota bacterium]
MFIIPKKEQKLIHRMRFLSEIASFSIAKYNEKMNIFKRTESAESAAFGFPKTKENMPDPEAEAKTTKAAEQIKNREDHELNRILSNPRWIPQSLEQAGLEKSKTFKENLSGAIAAVSKKTGYPEELIKKLYELGQNELKH